jgi:hypothetical protein
MDINHIMHIVNECKRRCDASEIKLNNTMSEITSKKSVKRETRKIFNDRLYKYRSDPNAESLKSVPQENAHKLIEIKCPPIHK